MSASLDDSVDASLDAPAADGAGPNASLVELSLDEDKVPSCGSAVAEYLRLTNLSKYVGASLAG